MAYTHSDLINDKLSIGHLNQSEIYENAIKLNIDYEINYPVIFVTWMAKFVYLFAYSLAHFLFVMCLTSYILNRTDPFTTLYTCFEYFMGVPIFREQEVVVADSDSESESDVETDIDSISKSNVDSESLLISTKDKLGKVPSKGDIIMFDEREVEQDELETLIAQYSLYGAVPRCISTYGSTPIEPEPGYICKETNEYKEGGLYLVKDVNSQIPNFKQISHIRFDDNDHEADKTPFTHIHVEPLGASIEQSESVFWYINYEAMAICQNESGIITEFINNLKIIGHDDRYRRSRSPSPTSSQETDSEQESERSDSYDLIENDQIHNEVFEADSITESRIIYYGGDPNFNDGDY